MKKYSDYIAEWLVEKEYTHCFFLAGGGCMHLIESFRRYFTLIPVVHEVTAGIAAEHFNQCTEKGKAFVLVTTGPGITNLVTAIAGAYVERRELLIISGQVKSTDLISRGLRQRGVQEIDGKAINEKITVECLRIKKEITKKEFHNAISKAYYPHPGPVLVEICLDIQGKKVDEKIFDDEANSDSSEGFKVEPSRYKNLFENLKFSKRPVLLIGGLVERKRIWDSTPVLEALKIPVATTTSAVDRVATNSSIWAGRPGTWGGQRFSNLIVAQADLLIVIGAQLDLQQTGFNWREFSPNSKIFQIYPCKSEVEKGHPVIEEGHNDDPNMFLEYFLKTASWEDQDNWLGYVKELKSLVPYIENNKYRKDSISSFIFSNKLSRVSDREDILAVCSSGGTFTGGLQVIETKFGQKVTVSPAFASMGYGLGTAIGASFSNPGKKIILMEGDGGFCQNLQELALVKRHNLPIKIFIFSNNGYASIRATQRKYFNGSYEGCDEKTGLSFPDWKLLFKAYDIDCSYINNDISENQIKEIIESNEPKAWVVRVDPEQTNWPEITSKINDNGSIESNPIYKMNPPLEENIIKKVTKYI